MHKPAPTLVLHGIRWIFKDIVFLENIFLNVYLSKVTSTSVFFSHKDISLKCLFKPAKPALMKRYLMIPLTTSAPDHLRYVSM